MKHTVQRSWNPLGSSFIPWAFSLTLIGGVGCGTEVPQTQTVRNAVTQCTTVSHSDVEDATISFPPKHLNQGSRKRLRVGGRSEALLKFDLSAVPSGATIDNATLTLVGMGLGNQHPVKIHAVTAPWSEGSVTYANFNQQFRSEVEAILDIKSARARKSADLTNLVGDWYRGAQSNYGILLRKKGFWWKKAFFVSNDSHRAGLRPKLEICYTVNPIDYCDPNPCQNAGACVGDQSGYTCECTPGYTGTDCEIDIDDCANDPCLNGGVCTDGVDDYTCACPAGFEGTNCETNTDECAGNPCQNGGICTDGLATYTCECAAGYEGINCETNIDECAGDPCQNGGACTDEVNGYTCACAAGYSGANCEIDIDDCASDPCLNDGTCIDGIDSFTCSCAAGYEGVTCAVNINECIGDPCLNGGTCVDGVNDYSCTCAAGYSGTNCETDIDDCAAQPCAAGEVCVDGVNSYTCTPSEPPPAPLPGEPGWTCPSTNTGVFADVTDCVRYIICFSGVPSFYNCNADPTQRTMRYDEAQQSCVAMGTPAC